jgi:tRNA modification GTPase
MSTIVAISSAPGQGAIAVIRLSGPKAIEIADSVFRQKAQNKQADKSTLLDVKSWTLHYGQILDGEREIDDVVVGIFRAPRSYTGENLVEISCHGSEYIQKEILQLLVRKGAQVASPGEFTQRAYLNGKLDLSQAEAVADLIASSSRASHQLAMDQMRGGFSSEISALRLRLLELVSLIELELDFSEEDVEFADRSQLRNIINDISDKVESLVKSFQLGNVLKEGVPVAIVGETNVGKSTLLNALLKEEKAIVSDIAGTTRDVIEDTIHVEGLLFRFIDTAGLRHTEDTIETIGIERSYQQMDKARIVILVTDPTAHEEQSLSWAAKVSERIRDDQHLIVVVNKGDFVGEAAERKASLLSVFSGIRYPETGIGSVAADMGVTGGALPAVIVISAKKGSGLKELEEALVETVNLKPLEDHDVIVSNVRHYEALLNVEEAVSRVRGGLDTGISGDFLSQDIREILHYLGEITGEISTDEILGNIFANFCIGK